MRTALPRRRATSRHPIARQLQRARESYGCLDIRSRFLPIDQDQHLAGPREESIVATADRGVSYESRPFPFPEQKYENCSLVSEQTGNLAGGIGWNCASQLPK